MKSRHENKIRDGVRPRRLALALVVSALAAQALAAPASASADTQSFTNPTLIKIPASGTTGPATPYPSSVNVSALPGPITDVNVTLHRVGHTWPESIGVLLVSPSGDTVNVMSGNCDDVDIEDFTWVFDQQSASPMPRGATCPDFVYRPNGTSSRSWSAPAPAGPHGLSLNAFNGENANGTWRLYVSDDGHPDTGDIEGGFTLTITTGPYDMAIPGTGTSGPANPYPATRTVSGETGVVTDVNVFIEGIWHQRPDDLDLLLVGPQGQSVVLMSDACGTFDVAAYGWYWNDEAPAPIPDGDGTNVCGATIQRPTDHEPGDTWPAPAPPGPYATSLSAFDLTDPNGEWRLFVVDDASGEVGFATNRFQLSMTTRPKATVAFTEDAVEVVESAMRALTLRRSGAAPLGAGSVTVTSVPASASAGTDFTPVSAVVQFAPGEVEKTVQVDALTDAEAEPDEVYAVSIGSPTGDAQLDSPSSVAVTILAPDPTPTTPPGTTPATTPSSTTLPGTTPPSAATVTLARLRVAPRVFPAADTGPSARPARTSRAGTIVSFTADMAADVTYRVRRARPGRRAGRRCVAPSRAPRRARRCTRFVAVRGSFTRSATAGPNRFRFTGRIRGRKLPPGRYQLRATPNTNGRNGATSSAGFRVVR